jgi:hypothetical protein
MSKNSPRFLNVPTPTFLKALLDDIPSPASPANLERLAISDSPLFDSSSVPTRMEFDEIADLTSSSVPDTLVLCLNCYESILLSEVDRHSTSCFFPEHDCITIKSKLKDFLLQIRELKLDADDHTELALIQLEDACKIVLGYHTPKNSGSPEDAFQRIEAVKNSHWPYLNVLFLSQRLSKMAEAFVEEMEATKSSESTEKHPFVMMETISYITSREKDSFGMHFQDNCEKKDMGKLETPSEVPDSLERYFYSQYLKKKLSLDDSYSRKAPSMFHLYQEVLDRKIPVAGWSDFISQSFHSDFNILS